MEEEKEKEQEEREIIHWTESEKGSDQKLSEDEVHKPSDEEKHKEKKAEKAVAVIRRRLHIQTRWVQGAAIKYMEAK